MKKLLLPSLLALSVGLLSPSIQAAEPLKVLLITGGCCHDYAKQKDLLKAGLEKRANLVIDQVHTDDKSVKPPLAIYGNPNYAKGYDVIIHDECAAGVSDQAVVEGVLAPHLNGTPGVNLHCAMHCYRIGNPNEAVGTTLGTPHGLWFEYLGLQSSGHGPQEPIELTFSAPDDSVVKGMANWTTIKEELYNNIQIFPTAKPLAKGKQTVKQKDGTEKSVESVVVWTNTYGPKNTRVFSTTVGHNNDTVNDDRYLDLVTRGVLWAAGKLGEDGKPAAGYTK